MRAIVIDQPGAPDVLTLAEVPRPTRIASEVLVKVVAAGVNPIDAKTRAGKGTSPAIASYPAVLGQDFSGVVVETPYEAHPLKPGDEVFGFAQVPRHSGTYAEYVSVPSLSVVRKPAVLSHVEAAGVPVAALTAWGMVVDVAKAHEGQRMLVHAAAGGVGHFAVQFAAYFGAHVIATGSSRNAAWLRELGAAEVIDYTTTAFDEVLHDVDVVIDLVGNAVADTGTRSLGVLRPGGLVVNAPSGTWVTVAEDAAAAGRRGTRYQVSPDGATLAVISRLLTSGDVRVYIDEVFDLEHARAAHEKLEGGHSRGKSVLKVCEG
ncbi:NADP-dependent oxidoreductase [Desertivibrio insolitus]|uniref:NADP-dependent oxidoreductase n=1 Tax=Herbiconiux sp. SYSU D00978 TaxID=2812562 RepID=UPI001A9786BA|nr:NADP-dependent oxidoreductase [Herbiconiux sp. SYSU D00978]